MEKTVIRTVEVPRVVETPKLVEVEKPIVVEKTVTVPEVVEVGEKGGIATYGKLPAGELALAEVGKPAPDVAFVDREGNERKLSDYRGRVLLLGFSSYDCPLCVPQTVAFGRVAEKYGDQVAIQMIAINTVYEPKTIERWMGSVLVASGSQVTSLPWAFDTDFAIVKYKVTSIPKTYIIDEDGVVWSGVGNSAEELSEVIDQLLS